MACVPGLPDARCRRRRVFDRLRLSRRFFDDRDLLVRQPIHLVYERVHLPVPDGVRASRVRSTRSDR